MKFRPEIDYYEVLQVHPRASQEMVKKAYRTLMGEMGGHPDLGGDAERARLLNEAYEVLGDADLRRAYDRARTARAGGMPWSWPRPEGNGGRPGSRPRGAGGPAGAELSVLMNRVLWTAVVVIAGVMIARVIKNPALDLADLIGMILLLLRIWGQAARNA